VWTKDVPLFADEHMPSQPRLDANLIALPCHQAHFDQRCASYTLDRLVLTDRVLALRILRVSLFLNQRPSIPHETIAPGARRRRRMPVDNGEVDALGFLSQELLFELRVRRRVLREHHDA